MKQYRWVILGLVASLVFAALSYFWATGIMDSLYAYRSPFQNSPVPAGAPVGAPLSKHVVFILVDALRVDTAADAQVMPYLNQLRAGSASATVHMRTPSYSFQGWTTLFTGAWQDLSDGPAMNPPEGESAWTWTQDNIFTAVHNAGMKTAYSGTYFFTQVIPPSALDASYTVQDETVENDVLSANEAVKFIQTGKYQFLLLHINQVDWAGHHAGGPRDPHWNEAATRSDALIKQVVSALDLGTDTVIVVSDHGQIDAGGHGGQEAIVLVQPFVMAGAGVKPGAYGDINQTDVAPTVTTLLGANIPAVTQGQILTQMLMLTDEQLSNIRSASITQQKTLYEAYAKAMGVKPVQITLDSNHYPITIFESAMTSISNDRLNRERLPRYLLAGILALLPAFFLFKKRGKTVLWFLISAVIYLIIFHVRYALLQGRTYSLSSVANSNDLILSTTLTTSLAFVVAWLVTVIILRVYSEKPLQATNTHIAFAWTLLYIAALPALWSCAYNGAFVTWTLPDMASTFMAFLSILQMLVLAVLGLLFMGITPLVALVFKKRLLSASRKSDV
jgi:hypothetical protein